MHFMGMKIEIVDPHLVHKDHCDDVLVYNARGALPSSISASLISESDLTEDEIALLCEYYVEAEPSSPPGQNLLSPMRFLRSVPCRLDAVQVAEYLAQDESFKELLHYYESGLNYYELRSKYLREGDEIRLMNAFVPLELRITSHERMQISAVLDKIPLQDRPSYYYMTLLNDTKNYFFYRKHHEHVPGIMLVEVARQAVYAQYYRTSQHRRGDVTLTIKKIDVEFFNYVDANYPVIICAETTDDPDERKALGLERRRVLFYQSGKSVAEINITGMPIKINVFKRLRNIKPDPAHWFVPVKNIDRTALFTGSCGTKREAFVNNVSLHGLNVTFIDVDEVAEQEVFDFQLNVDSIGYISGSATVRRMLKSAEGATGDLQITNIPLESERRWREAIKNFTHLDLRREVY